MITGRRFVIDQESLLITQTPNWADSVSLMIVATVPSSLREAVGEIEGMQILAWDLDRVPESADSIEVVVIPAWNSPWIKQLSELPRLRAIQLGSAGHEHALRFLPPGIDLAPAVGVHDTATAEMALALTVAAQRDIPDFVRAQAHGHWPRPATRRSLADSTALIYGYGSIGRALAARLRACEVNVVAVARAAREGDDHVDRVYAASALPELLPSVDVVAITAPLSPATRGTFGAQMLALIPDDALVVNVGRGPIIDTDALLAECQKGRLRAALDVTDPEPLPPDHPLWTAPGVLISPHTAGNSAAFKPRLARFVRSQLATYLQTGVLPHVVATG